MKKKKYKKKNSFLFCKNYNMSTLKGIFFGKWFNSFYFFNFVILILFLIYRINAYQAGISG